MGTGSAVVALSVNAGARYGANGEAFLLKHLGFKGSNSRSDIKLAREVEAVGVSVACDADRDTIVYSASGLRGNALGAGLEVVAESALTPKLIDWHVQEMIHEAVDVELSYVKNNAVKQLVEKLHEASFGKNTALGRPFYTEPSTNAAGVAAYHGSLFNTANMTVVGAGVSHSDLVAAAESAFKSAKKGTAAAAPKSNFVGGFAYQDSSSSLCHVAVGFNAPALGSAEYADAVVLKELWKQGAAGCGGNSFNIAYQDGGILGVFGACPAGTADKLTASLVSVLKAPITDAAFNNAKMAAKTQFAVAAENASSLVAVLASNSTNVDKASAAGVKALAAKLTKSSPALASVGPDSGIPAYNAFAKMF
jgi:predicted Zn-dependent peptidase